MKLAVVGTGISGLVAAHLLHPDHTVTVFEASNRVGGHTNTVNVPLGDRTYAVDTGFIVYNERTYPNFVRLLASLDVPTQPSDMSFSVTCDTTGLEYSSTSIFAQRRNLVRVAFLRMLAEITRFNRRARLLLEDEHAPRTLGELFEADGYSRYFVNYYLAPMMAAIWSTRPDMISELPAAHFLRFFKQHGLLDPGDRVQWRVVSGGSQRYVDPITRPFRDRIRLNARVTGIARFPDHVAVHVGDREPERFDEVIVATHSDQALNMLADATPKEQEILGAIPYQKNEVVLHTDTTVLPKTLSAWASWNYRLTGNGEGRATLTYDMNRLQGLDAPERFCVTMNQTRAIDPARVIERITYHHPVYSEAGVKAQTRHAEISGINRTHYCGAYWGYGFHEDGVHSALRVCKRFGKAL